MKVKPIPEGFHSVTPHLVCAGADKALEFYKKAFGAEEICRMPGPDGKSIMHAEMRVGDSIVMLCEEYPGMCRGPASLGGSPVTLHVYVTDTDAAFKRALGAGAQVVMPPQNMFWGDRYGKLKDPFGHEWSLATHVEDVPPEEMGKRAAAAFGECGKS